MSSVSGLEIKQRYQKLEAWANAYTAQLEIRIREATGWQRFHCFVMDQFEERYPDEHLSRDQRFVFLSLRVAISLKDIPPSVGEAFKDSIKDLKSNFSILVESFHETADVIDLDWHVSEKEWGGDEGQEFSDRVLADCRLIAKHGANLLL